MTRSADTQTNPTARTQESPATPITVPFTPSDYSAHLLVNDARTLRVEFSRSCLNAAISSRAMALVLSACVEPQEIDAQMVAPILTEQGLIEAGTGTFAVTKCGSGLVLDRFGNHALKNVERHLKQGGLSAALRAIEVLANDQWGMVALTARAEQIAQAIMDHLDVLHSFGSHLICLSQFSKELGRLTEAIEGHIARRHQMIQNLDRQISQRSQVAPPAVAGKLQAAVKRLKDTINRMRGIEIQAPAQAVSTAGLAFIKSDRARIGLQAAVLEAELTLLGVLHNLIEGEMEADRDALVALQAELNQAMRAGEQAEKKRDYGIAAGEILMNDSVLTQGAINYLWGSQDKNAVVQNIFSLYAENNGGKTPLAASAGIVSQELLADLMAHIEALVQSRMQEFTIVDALVALDQMEGSNVQQKLSEALKYTASLSQLAPNYDNFLHLQTFASIVFAPSSLPKANRLFDRLLSEALKPLNLDLDIQSDHIDSETLLFYCEFFSIPLSAFAFFDLWSEEFDKIKNEARLNPHPDLHN